jgi:hypothetical protein
MERLEQLDHRKTKKSFAPYAARVCSELAHCGEDKLNIGMTDGCEMKVL